jgi:glycosyltransferase involved in cell wall biosynthesis
LILVIGPSPTTGGGMGFFSLTVENESQSGAFRCRLLDSGGGGARPRLLPLLRTAAVVAFGRSDVCHLNVASGVSTYRKIALAMIASLAGKPLVLHLHGGGYVDFFRRSGRLKVWLVRRFFSAASRVVVLGDRWRDFAESDLRVPATLIDVVPNGTPDIRDQVSAHEFLMPSASREVVFVGAVAQTKGIEELLGAWTALCEDPDIDHDWRLVVAGTCAEPQMQVALDSGAALVGGRLQAPGQLTSVERDRLLARAALFVLPSWREGMPLSLLEAMSAGRPVLVTPVGAIPEVISDGCEGRVVPAREPELLAKVLKELLLHGERRDEMGRAGRERWEGRYSATVMYAALEDVWRRAIG